MKARIPSIARRGFVLGVILVVVSMAVYVTRDQIILNALIGAWNLLQGLAEWIVKFSVNHGVISVVFGLCLWIAILITHAYIETCPPHGINPKDAEPFFDKNNNGTWNGFVIENRYGEDLLRCWLRVNRVSSNPNISNIDLYWGKQDPSNHYQDILNGKPAEIYWLFFNNETNSTTVRKSIKDVIPFGESEIELEFGATSRIHGTGIVFPFWIKVNITDKGVEILSIVK